MAATASSPTPHAVGQRPTYFAVPHLRRTSSGKCETVPPHRFDVFEVRDNVSDLCFTMSNGGDRLQEILKRGIPLDDAKTLFYAMDE